MAYTSLQDVYSKNVGSSTTPQTNNTPYSSLKDVYSQQVTGTATQPPRQQVAPTHLVPKIKFDKNAAVEGLWDEEQRRLFMGTGGRGEGRGEYSVANLLTGLNSIEAINSYTFPNGSKIIGQTDRSFDINVPIGSFEVKEVNKPVKTGAHASTVLIKIQDAVKDALLPILKAYTSLSEAHKKQVDDDIKGMFYKFYGLPEPSPKARPATRQKYEAEASAFQSKYKNWTLKKYINNILSHLNELPRGILLEPKIDLKRYEETIRLEDGEPAIIFSIPQLEYFLHNLFGSQQPPTTPAINDIADLLFKYYGEKEADKDFFTQQAKNIDIKMGGEGAIALGKSTDIEYFKRTLAHTNMSEKVRAIKQAFGSEGLQIIFPGDGVFAVNENGYLYVPKSELGNYLQISSVSGGTVKIQRKRKE